MKLRLIHGSKLALYDGSDADFSSAKFRTNLAAHAMIFAMSELRALIELEALGFKGAALRIAQDLGFHATQFDGTTIYHGSQQGLQLFFVESTLDPNQRYICIFSFGESQASRFQLIQEAVYQAIATDQ